MGTLKGRWTPHASPSSDVTIWGQPPKSEFFLVGPVTRIPWIDLRSLCHYVWTLKGRYPLSLPHLRCDNLGADTVKWKFFACPITRVVNVELCKLMSTMLWDDPYHVPKYGEQVSQRTVTTGGLSSFWSTSNVSAIAAAIGDISAPVCGDHQGTLNPPCLPFLRCDNLGAAPKKWIFFVGPVTRISEIDFLYTEPNDPRGRPLPCAKIWGKSISGNSDNWGANTFRSTSNISAISADMREISVPVCGDPRVTLTPRVSPTSDVTIWGQTPKSEIFCRDRN